MEKERLQKNSVLFNGNEQYRAREELNAEEQFAKFSSRFPRRMRSGLQQDIAAFLGMSPETFSNLRSKK